MRFTCRQCRALLPGYIQRDLSPKDRERVSRHLSDCADCYVVYMGQRQVVRDLEFSLPRLGGEPRLDKMRAAVMFEMSQSASFHAQTRHLSQARYSVAALILMITLLLPWSIHSTAFALPTQPRPVNVTPQGTSVVVLPTGDIVTLTATLQSNYAPVPDATDTP